MLVHQRSTSRLLAASRNFPWKQAGIRPQALREDRILAEVHATGGDARRISDLFGIRIDSTNRYLDTLEHPASLPRAERFPEHLPRGNLQVS